MFIFLTQLREVKEKNPEVFKAILQACSNGHKRSVSPKQLMNCLLDEAKQK